MADLAFWSHGLAALIHGFFALYVFFAWRGGLPGAVLLAAVTLSTLWLGSEALMLHRAAGLWSLPAAFIDSLRVAAWYGFVLVLLRPLWGRQLKWPVWLALLAIAAQWGALLLSPSAADDAEIGQYVVVAWLAAAIVGLMLVEQLYRSLPEDSRWGIKPLCIGLGAGYIFELYLFADALLFRRLDADVMAVRGLAHLLVLPLVALSATRSPHWTLRMAVSREVIFHSTALAIAGVYLLVIAGAAYYVRYFGGEWGRALQMALLFAGLVLLGVLLFSGAQRARLKVLLNKHLFSYRYDYRQEWLRFTEALTASDRSLDLGQSVIKALGDMVESPGGNLWLRDEHDCFRPVSRLNRPASEALESPDSSLCRFLASREWVINLEEFRMNPRQYGELQLPSWLSFMAEAWLVVPLCCGGRLLGFVVLAAPRTAFDINWEVLDLLKTAQRQAAGYLERLIATEALLEARKFEAFSRMSAFVVHDLKNLVAQLSLMLKNAERHAHNPEFQQDMLETVAHVESRMRQLMSQLQEKKPIDPPRALDLQALLERLLAERNFTRVELDVGAALSQPAWVSAHPQRLERILAHIVQNALEASASDAKVEVGLELLDGKGWCVLVSDQGCGMNEEFIRERLFRPFQTTKGSGMGIGVYEARQYLGEIGGSLHYASQEGRGTQVRVELPGLRRDTSEVPEDE